MVETNFLVIFLSLFTSLIFIILLFIVWIANPKSTINRTFSIFLLSAAVWAFFTALQGLETTPFQQYFFNVILNIFGVFPAAISYFFFGLIFLRKSYKLWLFYAIPTYLVFSYLMTTDAFTFFVDEPFPGGYGFHSRQLPGDYFYLAIIWGSSFVVILLFNLIKDLIRKSSDKVHLQKVKLLLLTTIIGSAFAIIYNASPPLWGYPVDIAGQLLASLLLTYGILRFELVDVDVRRRNTLVNIIFAIFLAVVYSLLIILIQFILPNRFDNYIWWPAIIAGIYITSISLPFRERILRFVDITFYRTRYDYRETINKFASKVSEILELGELSNAIIKTIKETFGATSVDLFVLSKDGYMKLIGSHDFSFHKNDQIVEYLTINERVIGEEEIKQSLSTVKEVQAIKPQLIIPLISGGELVGFIFIGIRESEDFYSQEDKKLLFTLGRSSAIALKNALLYQEVLENKKKIEKLLEHEREVNESKNEFVTIVSHYLRTPLTITKGYLDLLIRGVAKSGEEKELLSHVYNEQKRLSTLVEDLISISSLEKGELRLFKTKISLVALVKKVADDLASLAKEKGLYLKTEFTDDFETVQADSQKLNQAISNLVDNAIKFTSIGGVTLKVSKKNTGAEICVEDTGIGIDPQEIPKLFQKFHRGTSITTFNYEGSGLGLHITKLIVEAHRGKVTVSSKLGTGSIFCIYLPIKS